MSTRDGRPDTRLQTGALKATPRKPKKAGKAKAAVEGKVIKKSGKGKASKKSPSKSPAKGKGKAAVKPRSKSPKKSVPEKDKRVIQHGAEEPWESEVSANRVSRILPLNDEQRAAILATMEMSARWTLMVKPCHRFQSRRFHGHRSVESRRMKQIDHGRLSHARHGDSSDSSMSVSALLRRGDG